LQVHDDLLFEYDEGLEDLMAPLITSALCGATTLAVPVTSSHVAGRTWGELE
jgi:DNA polymerase I-like protein with 3'-5' exonuclease and polymerase domains